MHKKVISIYAILFTILLISINVNAQPSNIIVTLGFRAAERAIPGASILGSCIINQESCAGNLFMGVLSKTFPGLAQGWNAIKNPQQALSNKLLEELAKKDPKAVQSLQIALEFNDYLQNLFPDAVIETNKDLTGVEIQRNGKTTKILEPPEGWSVKEDKEKGRLIATPKGDAKEWVLNKEISFKGEFEISVNEKTTEFYLQKEGTLIIGKNRLEYIKGIKDKPVLVLDLDEKIKSLKFETTKAVKNLKIYDFISIDAKKGSQIYYDAEKNEIDANNVDEARIIYENLKAKGDFKVKYTKDNALERITLKTKGSKFTLANQNIAVNSLGITEIHFSSNNFNKDTSKNKILVLKDRIIFGGGVDIWKGKSKIVANGGFQYSPSMFAILKKEIRFSKSFDIESPADIMTISKEGEITFKPKGEKSFVEVREFPKIRDMFNKFIEQFKSKKYSVKGEIIVQPYIKEASKRFDIDDKLIREIISKESSFRLDKKYLECKRKLPSEGSCGLMQIGKLAYDDVQKDKNYKTECTWEQAKTDYRCNILVGTAYFKQQLKRFGDIKLALAAYNWGPTIVDEKCEKTYESCSYLPQITKDYVETILWVYQLSGPQSL